MEEIEELESNETIIKKEKGDYWEKMILFMYSQRRGEYTITDKRIIFKGFFSNFSVKYEDISSISKCNVGPMLRFIPTGISIKTNDGKEYIMSVLGRNKYMEIIESHM